MREIEKLLWMVETQRIAFAIHRAWDIITCILQDYTYVLQEKANQRNQQYTLILAYRQHRLSRYCKNYNQNYMV